jgi:hypothetical protein
MSCVHGVQVLTEDGKSMEDLKKALTSLDEHFNDRFHYPVAIFGYHLTVRLRT